VTAPPVQCGGCRICCLGDTVALVQGDDPAQFKTKLVDGRRVLAKGKDGNCVYLGQKGCKIHGRQPIACRTLDCRRDYLALSCDPEALARLSQNPHTRKVLEEGRRRAELLPVAGDAL
jgi:Fe-S-cluster containining protein